MSMYAGYFAQRFALDPEGKETWVFKAENTKKDNCTFEVDANVFIGRNALGSGRAIRSIYINYLVKWKCEGKCEKSVRVRINTVIRLPYNKEKKIRFFHDSIKVPSEGEEDEYIDREGFFIYAADVRKALSVQLKATVKFPDEEKKEYSSTVLTFPHSTGFRNNQSWGDSQGSYKNKSDY